MLSVRLPLSHKIEYRHLKGQHSSCFTRRLSSKQWQTHSHSERPPECFGGLASELCCGLGLMAALALGLGLLGVSALGLGLLTFSDAPTSA